MCIRDRWCYGFDALAERVQEYPVDKVAEITWIPAEKIVAAAHLLAESKPATLQWGLAIDMTREAIPAGQAIAALFQITGNIDCPGGLVPPAEIMAYSGGWGRDLLPEEQEPKRLGLDRYRLLQMGFKQSSPDVLIETLETGEPYEIHGAHFQTTNGIACMGAAPRRVYNAFNKCDFIMSVDLFMTPTIMALADLVMPAATFPERNGIRVGDGPQRGEIINKVTQIGECKSDMEINLELGKRLNPEAWPWNTVEEMLSELLKPTGYTFEELREDAPVYLPVEYYKYKTGKMRKDGQPGFQTATGRIELWSTFYNAAELDPLPYFEDVYKRQEPCGRTGGRGDGGLGGRVRPPCPARVRRVARAGGFRRGASRVDHPPVGGKAPLAALRCGCFVYPPTGYSPFSARASKISRSAKMRKAPQTWQQRQRRRRSSPSTSTKKAPARPSARTRRTPAATARSAAWARRPSRASSPSSPSPPSSAWW